MSAARPQRSATPGKTSALTGFVFGLLTGLILALVVALYVSRVPVPFMDRGVSRNAEADKAETERNKNWDPNVGVNKSTAAPPPAPPAPAPNAPATSGDALGQLLDAKTTAAPVVERYVVQVGAFAVEADAQSQRARVALLGIQAQVLAVNQNGKTIYRVRTEPVDEKSQAEALREQLKVAGIEASLVRLTP